jgi:hypothetical protein
VPIEINRGVSADHDGMRIADHIYGASFLKRKTFHIGNRVFVCVRSFIDIGWHDSEVGNYLLQQFNATW